MCSKPEVGNDLQRCWNTDDQRAHRPLLRRCPFKYFFEFIQLCEKKKKEMTLRVGFLAIEKGKMDSIGSRSGAQLIITYFRQVSTSASRAAILFSETAAVQAASREPSLTMQARSWHWT